MAEKRRKPKPDPHIWRRDAAALYQEYGEAGQIARDRVTMDALPQYIFLHLATNLDFDLPNEVDENRGVDPHGRDAELGETAISLRLLGELMGIDTLQAWTRREIARRETKKGTGGPALARDLLDTGVRNPRPSRAKDPAKGEYKAMLRAVQRWSTAATEAHATARGVNLRRVNVLRGGSLHAAQEFLRLTEPQIGVYGLWRYSNDEHPAYVHTYSRNEQNEIKPGSVAGVQDVLANFGKDFIASVEAAEEAEAEYAHAHAHTGASDSARPTLVWLWALHVEVKIA